MMCVQNVTNIVGAWPLFTGVAPYRYEVLMVTVLALLLIGFLNYNFEAGFRMSFYGGLQARNDTLAMKASIHASGKRGVTGLPFAANA